MSNEPVSPGDIFVSTYPAYNKEYYIVISAQHDKPDSWDILMVSDMSITWDSTANLTDALYYIKVA